MRHLPTSMPVLMCATTSFIHKRPQNRQRPLRIALGDGATTSANGDIFRLHLGNFLGGGALQNTVAIFRNDEFTTLWEKGVEAKQ